jgi:molybdopterin synthase sulfur carrier subunit
MNTVQVKYFASVRERLGLAQEGVPTAAATVQALRAELVARGGAYAEVLAPGRAVRVAVNQVMANEDTAVPAQAEVAFFPPVTGG